jgi:transcriptional regulator with XRE-family HTH domain
MSGLESRIEELRRILRLNIGQFAEKMGVKRNTWANIEHGVNPCSDRYVNLICLTYRVRKEWLLEGKGDIFEKAPPIDPIAQDASKTLPPEVAELITIYSELVPSNQRAVLDFVDKILQSQRNTIKDLENKK